MREDLYYRLDVIEIHVPPLRSRAQDIPLLVEHFIRRASKTNAKRIEGVDDQTLAALVAAPWPGNVRELEHAIERAVILCRGNVLDLMLFPTLTGQSSAQRPVPTPPSPLFAPGRTLAEMERDAILRTLEAVEGSTLRAAKILGISTRKIQYKIKEYRANGVIVQTLRGEESLTDENNDVPDASS